MKTWMRVCRSVLLAVVVALSVMGINSPQVSAHWVDLASADILVDETSAQVTLTLPTNLIAFADTDGDQRLSTEERVAHQSELTALFRDRILVTHTIGTTPEVLTPELSQAVPGDTAPATHSLVMLNYQWTDSLDTLTIRYDLFPASATPQCLATIYQQGKAHSVVLTPDQPTVTLSGQQPWTQQASSFIHLGIEHIFTGYDHILFLIALLLPSGRLVNLLKIVTAFTLAHSLTLTLAVLNIVTLPSALVESVIALSIVYVAVENLWRKQFHHRWGLTFAFGLIHGLGFASILQEFVGTQRNLALSLVSFNLGVELGQIVIVVLVFLGLRIFQTYGGLVMLRRGISLAIILMGLVWFAERAIAAL